MYNWDGKEAECYRLYVEERKNLDEVMKFWEERGFTPRYVRFAVVGSLCMQIRFMYGPGGRKRKEWDLMADEFIANERFRHSSRCVFLIRSFQNFFFCNTVLYSPIEYLPTITRTQIWTK
jgi:hypothetical protein